MIQASVSSILHRIMPCDFLIWSHAYPSSPRIASMTRRALPIKILPHGMSQTPVRKIASENDHIVFLCIFFSSREWMNRGKYLFVMEENGNPESVSPAAIHERYITDHIAKVTPAGVIDVANMAEISACVIPPMRNGEPGTLTSEVNPIVMRAVRRRR